MHLHSYPINIVSDSLYSVFVLRNIETSTINSNQSIIQQIFLNYSLLLGTTLPPFILPIFEHILVFLALCHGNEQPDKLVSFATTEEQHALLHNNACSLYQIWKIPYSHAKKINNCSACRPPTSSTHCTRYQSLRITTQWTMANECNSLPWSFSLFLLTCLNLYKFFFYMGHTSPRWSLDML